MSNEKKEISKETVRKTIGENIQNIRRQNEMAQEELANLLEISLEDLKSIELGKIDANVWLLPKLSQIFNISINYFFEPFL